MGQRPNVPLICDLDKHFYSGLIVSVANLNKYIMWLAHTCSGLGNQKTMADVTMTVFLMHKLCLKKSLRQFPLFVLKEENALCLESLHESWRVWSWPDS